MLVFGLNMIKVIRAPCKLKFFGSEKSLCLVLHKFWSHFGESRVKGDAQGK